ncbi:MAG: hypothetical protein EXQ52_04945 [Bryobacterales bacterium]|nr:hypothetical protein [Bryobacterales bacterium]
MTRAQPQRDVWSHIVRSAKGALSLYFDPLRYITGLFSVVNYCQKELNRAQSRVSELELELKLTLELERYARESPNVIDLTAPGDPDVAREVVRKWEVITKLQRELEVAQSRVLELKVELTRSRVSGITSPMSHWVRELFHKG